MEVPISQAKAHLTELVRRAEDGEEIVLTRYGRPVVRLTRLAPRLDPAHRRDIMERIQAIARTKATAGPDAARSQDFLYDDDGIPT